MKNAGNEGTKKFINLLLNKGRGLSEGRQEREEIEKEIRLTYLDDIYLEKVREGFLNKGWSVEGIEGSLKNRLLHKELSKRSFTLTELEAALKTCVENDWLDSAREIAGLINLLVPK